ncbi:MAG: Methylaspartate ammonia-lyase 1 [Chloroflexi bacterium]|nr:Methylaspartate ammonia-lyase 1 [Chloroflexota bacterium]
MTRITRILTTPALGGYYYDDLAALQSQPMSVAERYTAQPHTPGFRCVREPAEALSVGLVLDDGRVAWGDCVAVEFSGKAGRDPVFRSQEGMATIQRSLAPLLENRPLTSFRALAAEVDALTESMEIERLLPKRKAGDGFSRRELFTAPARLLNPDPSPPTERVTEERPLHTAIRYGVSQALLQAVALAQGTTMAEVICREWNLPLPQTPIPIHAQCGADRYDGADKMIAKRVDSLPHSLVDNIPEHIGQDAVVLTRYVRWLSARINELGGEEYVPTIHLDVHGALGEIYDHNLGRVLGALSALEQAAQPYPLRVECPLIGETRQAHIKSMQTLRDYLRIRKMKVEIVADEWANTLEDIGAFIEAKAAHMIQVKMPDLGSVCDAVEAVLACQAGDVKAFLGGSCAETDLSARVSAHVALATRPEMVMAKPGMGIDEGIAIINNEMQRTLATIHHAQTAHEA